MATVTWRWQVWCHRMSWLDARSVTSRWLTSYVTTEHCNASVHLCRVARCTMTNSISIIHNIHINQFDRYNFNSMWHNQKVILLSSWLLVLVQRTACYFFNFLRFFFFNFSVHDRITLLFAVCWYFLFTLTNSVSRKSLEKLISC